MFLSGPCGSPLSILPKTRLKKITLVFLRIPFLFIIFTLPLNQVFSAQNDASESKSSSSSVNQELPNVVVNHEVPEQSISLKKLRAIFAMKLRFWEEGKPITVFVLAKDDPVHAAFCKKILNIFPNQLESVWYRQVYTGTGQAPIEVASESELIERVKNTPGAIGYINNKNENIKRFSDEINILKLN
tara:strand:- start:8273 stop:8833 length:561 start_codon:yes stop_codon:yes gene_type:complete